MNTYTHDNILVKNINFEKVAVSKPILKWVGGKTQIMEHITKNIPNITKNYHEPFVGGGSVLFKILEYKNFIYHRL